LRANNTFAGTIAASATGQVSYGLNAGSSNTTGSQNTHVGSSAGRNNTAGIRNTTLGFNAGLQNSTGSNNTMVGTFAGNPNTASENTMVGSFSGTANTTGTRNTYLGTAAGQNGNGSDNTYLGHEAGSLGFGSRNTFVGRAADQGAFSNATDISLFGFNARIGADGLSNATAIGSGSQVSTSNALVLGSISGVNGATANTNVGIGTTAPLDRLHVAGNIRMVDGNQAVGKVLTSDANGTATWQAAPSATADWGRTGNAGTSATTNFIGTTDAQDFRLRTNNLERLSVTSAGNVGIGTTAPATSLHVAGSVRIADGTQALGRVFTSDANGTGTWQSVPAASIDWGRTGNAGTNASTNFIGTTDAVDFRIRTNNVERVNVTSAGKVGIGTSTGVNTSLVVAGGIAANLSTTFVLQTGTNTVTVGDRTYIGLNTSLCVTTVART
ncbi:MAG TPA: hypothetical protein PK760_13395, partial [Flavobacteriales bacterium]|nr:hypothetical protein [Flavobacteriales bacterium]